MPTYFFCDKYNLSLTYILQLNIFNQKQHNMVTLTIENSKINKIPTYFFYFTSHKAITKLYLIVEKLENLRENDLKSFINLTHLTLVANNLQTISMNSLQKFDKLEYLYLEVRNLTDIPFDLFANLQHLQHLTIIVPKLKMLPTHLLNNNREIIDLKIDFGRTFDVTVLQHLRNVRLFDCSQLYSTNTKFIRHLQTLKLNRTVIEIESIQSMTTLTNLYMSSCIFPQHVLQSIVTMPQLKHVTIDNNFKLIEIDFNSIRATNSITYFRITFNNIVRIKTNSFGPSFRNLQILNLSNNRLSEIKHKTFHRLHHLTCLDLSHNQIAILDLFAFNDLINLQTLNLASNCLKSYFLVTLIRLKHLKRVHLSFNRLNFVDIMVDIVDSNRYLECLDFQCNDIRSARSCTLTQLSDLKYFYLSHNLITVLEYDCFVNFVRLQYLDLSYNLIKVINTTAFFTLYNLKILKLSHNRIEELPCFVFQNVRHLELLDLSSNHIAELRVKTFQFNRLLKRLYLNNNCLQILSDDLCQYSKLNLVNLAGNMKLCSIPVLMLLNSRVPDCCYILDEHIKPYLILNKIYHNFKIVLQ